MLFRSNYYYFRYQGEVIKDGSDIAILAYGHTVDGAMMVSNMFEKEGVSVAVINARFAKPVEEPPA